MSRLSFSFKKKVEKPSLLKTNTSIVAKEDLIDHGPEEPEYIIAINDRVIESHRKKEEKPEPIIPCIRVNNWRDKRFDGKTLDRQNIASEPLKATEENPPSVKPSLDQLAQDALVKEATGQSSDGQTNGALSSCVAIPLLMQNRVPQGFEEDGNFDVSVRAPEPKREDYEQMPVEQFGLAMLRGMGYKPGVRDDIKPLDPKIRAKGLGLGADVPTYKQKQRQESKKDRNGDDRSSKHRRHRYIPGEDDEEDAAEEERRKRQREQEEEEVDSEIRTGAQIQVQAGEHAGLYGVVESVGDDLSNSVVRLALKSSSAVIIANPLLKVVSRKEYEKYAKVLNKKKVDQYYRDKRAKGDVFY